jgi:hypothetical protein
MRKIFRWLPIVAVVAFACGDDDAGNPTAPNPDAGPAPTSTSTTPPPEAGPPDGGPTVRTACLDRPTAAPRPTTKLPCELIPPGVTLKD